jgi:PH-interacting protein/bromodomain and WD repeat domain-containing protein 1/3
LDAHPLWPDQVLSAGHDGLLIAWHLVEGAIISQDFNAIEGRGTIRRTAWRRERHWVVFPAGWGSLFDLAISPDGTLVATVDSLGHLSILGIGKNNAAKTMPNEQFFHTDYRSGRGQEID